MLRIEDTDRARSSEEHITDIKEALDWLELDWDNRNTEHYQSRRLDEYKKVAQKLVNDGYAEEREGAIYFKVQSQISNLKSQNNGVASQQSDINHQSPITNHQITFDDLIHGEVSTKLENIEDFVILKSDGWPTYHLAVIADDHDMKITHVIRGDDHLSNTPKHILLYRALGWEAPQFGHLPLILNKDRTKMSKRKDPVSVTDDFKNKGYLSDAMVNFLALLGWNPKTDEEFFSLVELVEKFEIKNVQKSNAVFDTEKLNHFNAHYLRKMSAKELVEIAKPLWEEQYDLSKTSNEYLERIVAVVVERAQTTLDLAQNIDYFLVPPKLVFDDLIFKKSTQESTLCGITTAADMLKNLSLGSWTQKDLKITLEKIVEKTGLQNGDVFWPVRYALTGEKASPKPEEMLQILGKEESLRRIETARDLLNGRS